MLYSEFIITPIETPQSKTSGSTRGKWEVILVDYSTYVPEMQPSSYDGTLLTVSHRILQQMAEEHQAPNEETRSSVEVEIPDGRDTSSPQMTICCRC